MAWQAKHRLPLLIPQFRSHHTGHNCWVVALSQADTFSRVQTRLLEIFRSLVRFPVWPGLPFLYIISDSFSEKTLCPSASLSKKNWSATFLIPWGKWVQPNHQTKRSWGLQSHAHKREPGRWHCRWWNWLHPSCCVSASSDRHRVQAEEEFLHPSIPPSMHTSSKPAASHEEEFPSGQDSMWSFEDMAIFCVNNPYQLNLKCPWIPGSTVGMSCIWVQ